MRQRSIATSTLLGIVLALAPFAGCGRHDAHDQGLGDRTREGRMAPLLENLGKYHREVTTNSADAQRFFDQGLILVYGFNHAEALRSFQEAARIDPRNGMTYWGQALALAPNINDSAIGNDREQQGYEAIQQALQNKAGLKPVEVGFIDALAARFTSDTNPDRAKLNRAYADAMGSLFKRFPGDPDVAVLYADAVMNTMPWDYWGKDGKPKPGISEALGAIETAIRISPDHPGANHIYIHAVEASPDPDRAIPSAEKLGGLVPGAGHLVHMPSHIFIRVGRYGDASEANIKAIAADEDYITQCRAQGIYPAAYYPHNIHFLFASLAMEGRSKEAMEAARKVSTRHESEHLEDPNFGFAHLLKAMPMFAMVRFGQWDNVLKEPEPDDNMRFARAMRHWSRGHALVAKNDLQSASAELEKLRQIAKDPALGQLKIMDLNDLGALARIGENLLAADIAAKQRKTDEAVKLARTAVEIDDNLLYSEPPDWPMPPRHVLGSILLEAGRAKQAEQVFREDLKRHRNNGWALRGLADSLKAQGRTQEAGEVEDRFRQAWAKADLQIASARI